MTDGWQSIKIKQFEHVMASPSTALLRVSGKPPRRRSAGERPALLVEAGPTSLRFAALPAPLDPRGVLRAAYSVPIELVGSETRFSLEHSTGSVTELPPPQLVAGRAGGPWGDDVGAVSKSGSTPPQSPETIQAQAPPPSLADGEERRSDPFAKLAEQSEAQARSEHAAAESDQARRLAEDELRRLRGQFSALEQQLMDAEAARAQAEQATVAAEQATADAEAQLESALGELTGARERGETLQQRNVELESASTEQQELLETLQQELADRNSPHEALQRELDVLRSRRASLEHELDQSRDQLRIMTSERDELGRQASAYDSVAVKARERAAQAEAANEQMSATLRELETWRGELERRLTATSSELGVVKTAREADERELQRLRAAVTDTESKLDQGDAGDGEASAAPGGDSSQTLAAQAAEIEQPAAELASLRAGRDVVGAPPDPQTTARLATLEAERAEIARRAEQLAELAGAMSDRATAEQALAADDAEGVELISRNAERSAREQAERELRAAASDTAAPGTHPG